jgi:hypothetical protein
VIQIVRRSVGPVDIARGGGIGVVLIVQMMEAVGVHEHAIWVVNEAYRRGVADLRPKRAIIFAR